MISKDYKLNDKLINLWIKFKFNKKYDENWVISWTSLWFKIDVH